jgi:hypothetical protein
MSSRKVGKLWLPVAACILAAALSIAGGACLYGSASSPPAPTLHTGRYILTLAGSQSPPQVSFTDAGGRRIRVIADTIEISTQTSRTYVEHGSIAITPPGGTEQAPTPIALGTQTWAPVTGATFDLPVTVAGLAHGTVVSDVTIDLRMPDGSHWTLNLH